MSWNEVEGLQFVFGDRRFRIDWSFERARQRPKYYSSGGEALRLARSLAVLTGELARHQGLQLGVSEVRILDRESDRWWTISPEGTAAEVLPVAPQPPPKPWTGPTIHYSGRS